MSIEAIKQMVHELEYVLDCINNEKMPFDGDDFHEALRLGRQAIAEAEKNEHPKHFVLRMAEQGRDIKQAMGEANDKRLEAEKQEPVALKKGECWPEEVMRQWDYWRKEIANGHTGSAPRDWFEGLSELRLIDTHPQPKREPLTDEQMTDWIRTWFGNDADEDYLEKAGRAIEAAHKIGGKE